jgi:hypothetical protein
MTICISTLAYFVNLLLQHCLGILAASILFALHQSRHLYSEAMSATVDAFNVVSTAFLAHWLTRKVENSGVQNNAMNRMVLSDTANMSKCMWKRIPPWFTTPTKPRDDAKGTRLWYCGRSGENDVTQLVS